MNSDGKKLAVMEERLFNFKPVKLAENVLNNLFSSVEKFSKNHFNSDGC